MSLALRRLPVFLESIKFSHSIFALPFALISMLLAAGGMPSVRTFAWIVVACVAARTAAMAFNRIADLRFDARNPRTKTRALVTGALSRDFMFGALVVSSLLFFVAAGMLNPLCLFLAPPTLAVLCFYSLTKRFTRHSHYFLGLALGLAPVGAWIAVRGTIGWTPLLLGLAVLLWVAGFDMLYACQDYEYDRAEAELHSTPKTLGIAGALERARKVHALSLVFFALFWWSSALGFFGLFGVVLAALLIRYEHSLLKPTDLSKLNAAFFTANGMVALAMLAMVALDLALTG